MPLVKNIICPLDCNLTATRPVCSNSNRETAFGFTKQAGFFFLRYCLVFSPNPTIRFILKN